MTGRNSFSALDHVAELAFGAVSRVSARQGPSGGVSAQ